jgi:hypothetical protein
MKRLALILFALMSLAVVEETPIKDVVTSPTTFAVCKAVDIASTAYLIHNGLAIEANPIVAATLSHGYFPLIAISVGIYFLLKHYNDPIATGVANVATCGVAVHNLLLIP